MLKTGLNTVCLNHSNKMKKYIVYATSGGGNGAVMKIGEYEQVEDIQIQIAMFANDVVINIEIENEDK